MARITLQGISKTYGQDIVAVDDIAGLEEVSSGEIRIDGRLVNEMDPADRDLAVVFQNYALYPHMTVSGNLSFGLRLRGVEAAEIGRRINGTATMLGIEGLLGRRPRELSGGQQQRVALGRALVRDPIAFLFDEPLSSLDAKLRSAMRTELIKIHRGLGRTILHVTHDQVEAMTMGERICIMRDGRVVQTGPPLEVYRRPVDTFVAGFLASPPMNLLNARVAGENGALEIDLSPTRLRVLADRYEAPAPHRDSAITFGIRSEDLYTEPVPQSHAPLDVEVVAVEALGPEVVLVAALPGGEEISARLGRSFSAPVGAGVRLYADLERAHFFDSESGRAVDGN